jgi:hypothetical protein
VKGLASIAAKVEKIEGGVEGLRVRQIREDARRRQYYASLAKSALHECILLESAEVISFLGYGCLFTYHKNIGCPDLTGSRWTLLA